MAGQGSEMTWVCIPIAVDTGSCANVTPPGVFAIEVQESEASKNKTTFYGANTSPIMNLGNQPVVAKSNEGYNWMTTFAVADELARPLASGFEITEKGNEVAIWKGGGHIKYQNDGATTALTRE